jgi:putative membrane protein
MPNTLLKNDRFMVPLVWVLSVVVPLVVAFLLVVPSPDAETVLAAEFLPKLNAMINSTVTVLLIVAFVAIRRRQFALHKWLMLSAFFLSILFLVSYITYHYLSEEKSFGGQGAIRYVYFFILISHILLSAGIVPLALFSIYRGLRAQNDRHRKIVRWTLPLWLYVSVTGVLVYLFVHVWNPAIP